ncbi:MAG TPA: S8 family serine peptidase [Actinokineospora sp.]|nr:S8 family serine peptidase [Actinokineospora sp.]
MAAALAATAMVTAGIVSAATAAQQPEIVQSANALPGRYIVTFKDSAVQQQQVGIVATDLANKHGGTVGLVYRHALRGFSVAMSEAQAKKLAAEPAVARVETDGVRQVSDTQTNPPSWGTDRVDQKDLPLDQKYSYPTNAGQGATVYVLDTGIRKSHQDFGTRASFGRDFVDNDDDSTDCHGHGTHVAGTAAGNTYGLAKKANIVAVRVLNCSGSGSDSQIIGGIDWVKANARKPAVVNFSIGCGGPCTNETEDTAVRNVIASGVQFVQAAGNSNDDACRYSPQRVAEAVTVGNTQQNDAKNSGSSWGTCLDLFAPGTSIVSASYSSDTGNATMTGTSMASPQVAGAAALYLGLNPGATPQQVRDALVDNATSGKVTSPGTGSPNKLLYTGFMVGGGDPTPPTAPGSLRSTGTTVNSVSLAWDASSDDVGVVGYDVFNGPSIATSVTATSATVTGLTADTSYTFTVKARDAAGNVSPASAAVTARTKPGTDPTSPIVNGGFESELTGWSPSGTAVAVNSGAHSGTYAARLGATTATNGVSSIAQTFTAPADARQLSFYYSMTCPDTVYYAWAKATLVDNTSGATTTPLAKTCTNGQGWKQATAALTGGHSYTLTLVNRDDNYPADPVYTLFDDVTFDVEPPSGDDYSVTLDPSTVSVQAGQSGTTTARTTVTSGGVQKVHLAASGLPSGATATFDPADIASGEISTLTIATTAGTPQGSTSVTVSADGSVTDHTATLTLSVGGGTPPAGAQKIGSDPYSNAEAQHATQLEADSHANGNTIVTAFQNARIKEGGATGIGWSTSTDGGVTWRTGKLPWTKADGGPYDRAGLPVVGFSAKHGKWLIAGLPLDSSVRGLGLAVSTSTDGVTWGAPAYAVGGNDTKRWDKNWLACDNHASSARYGNCYAAIDDNGSSNQLYVATSTDGGTTWGAAKLVSGATGALANGIASQPNGNVVVIYDRVSGGNNQMAVQSTDGGNTWGQPVSAGEIRFHQPAGGLRGNPMPSLDVDAGGKYYLAWPDSKFRADEASNDIVLATSTDGKTWTAPVRVPIDAVDSGKDHYFPTIAVEPGTSGSTAKIALFYYVWDKADCTAETCQLSVASVTSVNGGASWSAPKVLGGPFTPLQIADTASGRFVGNYSGGSVVNGKAVGVFSLGKAPADGKAFDQAIYTGGPQPITGGALVAGGSGGVARAGTSGSQRTRME